MSSPLQRVLLIITIFWLSGLSVATSSALAVQRQIYAANTAVFESEHSTGSIRNGVSSRISRRGLGSLKYIIDRLIENWNGRRQPDYEIMYWEYTIPLHCSNGRRGVPIGVFGFYRWVSTVLTVVENASVTLRELSSRTQKRHWIYRAGHGLVSSVQYTTYAVLNSRLSQNCRSSLVGLTDSDGRTVEDSLTHNTYIDKIIWANLPAGWLAFTLSWWLPIYVLLGQLYVCLSRYCRIPCITL
jgi:hypothetical protein